MPIELLGKSLEELRAVAVALGEPAYRGAQLYHALYAERQLDFAGMTALPAKLRRRLAEEAAIGAPRIVRSYPSADGSVRYLLGLEAAKTAGGTAVIEAVFMPAAGLPATAGRQTICVSTQAGCAVNCRFCLTATLGLIRNLTIGQIVGQVLRLLEAHRGRLAPRTNVVFMGQGEPLLNYDATIAAAGLLLDPNGMALAPRHVTISTSGIIPGIERLARERIRPKLAISLNASNDEQRSAIMPINRKYSLEALLDACRRYPLRSWERLTFEYVLLGGMNDRPEDARRVARLVTGLRAKVNLIPWNPGELPYRRPEDEVVEAFRGILAGRGVPAFVRDSRGRDVMGACGQLALIEQSPTLAGLEVLRTEGKACG